MKFLNIIYALWLILQPVNSLLAQEEKCKLDQYDWFFSEAQQHYNSQNYLAANEGFKKAFALNDFPFARDMELAMKTAYKVKDEKWSYIMAIHLAKSGVPLSYFKKFTAFNWYQEFKSNFEQYKTYFNKHFDIEFREKIWTLAIYDSAYNATFHEFRRGEKLLSYEYFVGEAFNIRDQYWELYQCYGFPSEGKTGYFIDKETNRISGGRIYVLLRHIYQRHSNILREELSKIACEGEVSRIYFGNEYAKATIWREQTDSTMTARFHKYIIQYEGIQDLEDSVKIDSELKN